MVSRLLRIAVVALSLAACGTVPMSEEQAVDTTAAALSDADIDAEGVVVDSVGADSFTLSAPTSEGEISLVLDAGSGRFTSIDLAEGVPVTDAQIEVLARHHENPADDRARTRRSVIGAVLVVLAIAGGLTLARRARLREAAANP